MSNENLDVKKTDEQKAQEAGTVQHQARKRNAKQAAKDKESFKIKKEWYGLNGKKIIKYSRLENGNLNKVYAGTKKTNPKAYAKIAKGK